MSSHLVSDETAARLLRAAGIIERFGGDGVVHDGENIRLYWPPDQRSVPPDPTFHPVFILGDEPVDGPGCYTGHPMLTPENDFDPTDPSAFSEDDIGPADTDTTVYLINCREANKSPGDPSQHDLQTSSDRKPQRFLGLYSLGTFSDGRAMWVIDGRQGGNCG